MNQVINSPCHLQVRRFRRRCGDSRARCAAGRERLPDDRSNRKFLARAGGVFIALVISTAVENAAAQSIIPDHTSLTLLGTVAGSDSSGLAVIQRTDGAVQFVKRGGEVKGYTVTAVIPAAAFLRKDEKKMTLELAAARPVGIDLTETADLTERRRRVRASIEERRNTSGAEPLQGSCGEIRFFNPDGTEVNNSRLILSDELADESFAPLTNDDWACPSPSR